MKTAQIGLEVVPSSGGTYKAISDFSQVMNSLVISFTSHEKQIQENLNTSPTRHVSTSPGLWGRSFAWAPERNRREAGEAVINADLLVCHILWRYHVHWVKAQAVRNNIPYWVIPHGCLDPYVFSYRSLEKKVWFYLFGRSFLKRASYVIFATEQEKQKAGRYYNGKNTRVIHWPVQSIDLSRREFARGLIRHRHEVPCDDRIVIFLGRLHHLKHPLNTIAAFAKANVSNTHLFVIGPEETVAHKDCQRLIGELGARNVHLVGPVYGEDKNDYLIAGDAYISLSEKENFGYTAAEALLAGLPVILSPGNDLVNELRPLECGWFLKNNVPETAAIAIKRFAGTNDRQLAEMGENGRKWASENLGYKMFTEKITRLVERTLSSKQVERYNRF